MGKVYINACTFHDLLQVPGIGDDLARDILDLQREYRGELSLPNTRL